MISKQVFPLLHNYFIKQSFENDIRPNHLAVTKSRDTSRVSKVADICFCLWVSVSMMTRVLQSLLMTSYVVKQFWIKYRVVF